MKLFGTEGYKPENLKWMKYDERVKKTKIKENENPEFAAGPNIELINID